VRPDRGNHEPIIGETEHEMLSVAFIGLGEIGYPVASHVAQSGDYRLTVFNRSAQKTQTFVAAHPTVQPADSVGAAVQNADVLITCVGNDQDLGDVFFDCDACGHLPDGATVIDHTTASVEIARRLSSALSRKSIGFVDAPVSGGSAGAKAGKLTIMLGGSDTDVARAQPLLALYSGRVTHIGEVGTGQLAKMVNQVCIAGVLEGLAEGLGFAEAAGLDLERVLEAISAGAASSWQMQNRSSFMTSRTFQAGFAAKLMHKDLRLAIIEGSTMTVPLPVAGLVLQQYSRLLEQGYGEEDFSNLFRLIVPPN
jgi:3-hydroxyisobutyrate dehydrogenase